MQEEYQAYSHRRCDECKRKDSIGVHQLHDFKWLCVRCYNIRKSEKAAPYIDWSTRETVDNLTEAMHYFAHSQNGNYNDLHRVGQIKASRGVICFIVEKMKKTLDPFGAPWEHFAKYYILYNRRYLNYADRVFERANMFHKEWQSVHMKVVDTAAAEGLNKKSRYYDSVYIAIVMPEKNIHYMKAELMQKFVFEYETENILPREFEGTAHIPVDKMYQPKNVDPFPW